MAHPDFRYNLQHATVLGNSYNYQCIAYLMFLVKVHYQSIFIYVVDVLRKVIDCRKIQVLKLVETEYQKVKALHKELQISIDDQ